LDFPGCRGGARLPGCHHILRHDRSRMASAIAALAILFCLRPAPAIADYRLCNMTSYVLMGAIGYQADTGWRSHGWARLLPGACGTALPGPIGKAGYHVFARSIEAHRGT